MEGATTPSTSLNVLIAEDSMLPARELAVICKELGLNVLGPAPTLKRAEALFDSNTVDIGLLDVTLREERVFPLARRFRERGTPFAFLTGYSRDFLPPDLSDAKLLEKPIREDKLREYIHEILATRTSKE